MPSNAKNLLSEWSAHKARQLIPWRYNLRSETLYANLDNKKVKMNRKIRSIFPRGKRFDRIAKDCVAVPKDLQDE